MFFASRRQVPAQLLATLMLAALSAMATSCGAPAMDASTAVGMQAILDQVNQDLSIQDCADAISLIEPVYNSSNTNNTVRMAMAESYACSAHFNLLDTVQSLTNGASLSGGGFFGFLAVTFPSSATNPADRVVEGAELASDALMASFNPGAVILPTSLFNPTTDNPDSVNYTDRTGDSNVYLMFMSMVAIGGLENRYGKPNASGAGTQDLPWVTGALVTADGCAFGASMANFADSIGAVGGVLSGPIATAVSTLQTAFADGINTACEEGCNILCGGTVSCTGCPLSLRNRSSCAGTNTDVNSCAVAGLTQFVNAAWVSP